jgi:hypothetical protein
MQSNIVYKERQFFRNPFVIILLLGIVAMTMWAMIQQIFLGQPFGNNPAPDSFVILFSMFPIIFLLFFLFMRLDTNIDETSISVSMSPFGRRKIAWKNIDKAYVRKYKPIMEFGGWGIRYGFGNKGMAFTVGGTQGLQLELSNGKKVLIGTKKASELSEYLKQINKV